MKEMRSEMSQGFADFRQAVNSNPQIAEACRAAILAGGQGAIVTFGAKHGFTFSADEAKAAMDETELSDMELELVAGGETNPPPKPTT
jgi:predicted ribosomally synthesized peptide with nif11-like leader